ncbi:MAG: hypothetical protein ACLFMX_02770 [Halobacteriales archaeon]
MVLLRVVRSLERTVSWGDDLARWIGIVGEITGLATMLVAFA